MRLRTPAPPPDLARRPPDEAPVAVDLRAARRRQTWRARLRQAAAVVGAVALLALATWLIGYSDVLALRSVSVSGAPTGLAADVRKAADAPVGVPLARVDTKAVQQRVEAVPEVRSASVSRGWPHTLRVAVTPRTPVAALQTEGGWQFVDADGVVFGAAPGPADDLPVIIAPTGEDGAPARKAAVLVAGALPADLLRTIGRIEAPSPVEVRLVLRDGRPVEWGTADRSDRKASVLAALLATPATAYDVSVPDRPSLRPAP